MSEVDLLIVGAALAGRATIESVLGLGVAGARILSLDAGTDLRASANPGAIMHGFPGRKMELWPGRAAALEASVRRLRGWRARFGEGVVLERPMLRPLRRGDERDVRMRASYLEHHLRYPSWLESRLLDARQVEELAPWWGGQVEGIVYEPAFVVDMRALLQELEREQRAAGVRHLEGRLLSVEPGIGGWRVIGESGESWSARQVVLAMGVGLIELFPGLGLRNNWGELLRVEALEGVELGVIVSPGGHLAPHPGGGWVGGSSYLRLDDLEGRQDVGAIQQLQQKLSGLMPSIGQAAVMEIWRGSRAVYGGDRRPIVGQVDGARGLWLLGGLGSKGLLWAPLLAEGLARGITGGPVALPAEVGFARLGLRWGVF